MSDYDQVLQEQEENDLLRAFKQRDGYRGRFNANDYFDGDTDTNTGGDDSEEDDTEKYSDKEQLVAFLLSLFFGQLAVGRFYVGDYKLAIIKLLLPCMSCILFCIVGCFLKCINWCCGYDDDGPVRLDLNENNEDSVLERLKSKLCGDGGLGAMLAGFIPSCASCAQAIWIVVDWFLFGFNQIPDGDGKTLYPM